MRSVGLVIFDQAEANKAETRDFHGMYDNLVWTHEEQLSKRLSRGVVHTYTQSCTLH